MRGYERPEPDLSTSLAEGRPLACLFRGFEREGDEMGRICRPMLKGPVPMCILIALVAVIFSGNTVDHEGPVIRVR
jgi:hypothetical protein